MIIERLDAFLSLNYVEFVTFHQIVCSDFRSIGENERHIALGCSANTGLVGRVETIAARARIRPVQILAHVTAGVCSGGAFVDVDAFLAIVFGNDEAGQTMANVATVRQILALLFAATDVGRTAMQRVMASQFVGPIAAIVSKIAHILPVDAFLVGTLELIDLIARLQMRGAQRHIVLVTAVAAIIDAIANLITCDAAMVSALEAPQRVAIEIRADRRRLIAIVAAIIGAIANVGHRDAQMIGALES